MNDFPTGFGWKQNWADTRRHFLDWWKRNGLAVSTWAAWMPARVAHAECVATAGGARPAPCWMT